MVVASGGALALSYAIDISAGTDPLDLKVAAVAPILLAPLSEGRGAGGGEGGRKQERRRRRDRDEETDVLEPHGLSASTASLRCALTAC